MFVYFLGIFMDIEKLRRFLTSTAESITNAAEIAQTNPVEAMKFVPAIMENFKELQKFGDFSDFSVSGIDIQEKNAVAAAIGMFLTSTKEAQEKVGSMGATLFAAPYVKEVTENLEQVKASLERGKRVEAPEKSSGA